MEIPQRLKSLYNHWVLHTEGISTPREVSSIDRKLLNEIGKFASERMWIWEKKEVSFSPPLTSDPTLQKYRFCNIYRELDKQTIQIHTLLNQHRGEFDLWLLNLMYCRFSCSPDTVIKTGLLNFNETHNQQVYENLINLPKPKYGSAYVFPINSIAKTGYGTRESFFCYYLSRVAKQLSESISTMRRVTVNEALNELLPILGVNFRFHMTEILIDVAYQYPEKIDLFKDFHIGPGAIPTLANLSKSDSPEEVLNTLVGVQIDQFPYLTYNGKRVNLSAENWEGIACEFRKYSNLRKGIGRVRLYL